MARQTHLQRKSTTSIPVWTSGYLGNVSLERSLKPKCPRLWGRMLDLGCGNSPYRSWLNNVTAYVGYDIDVSNPSAQVVGSAMVLPFAEMTFDSILCTQVLEHVDQPWIAVDEMARVLKKDGVVLLSVPQCWRIHEAPYDYFRYTKYGLDALLKRSGLEVVDCLPQGGAWLVIGQTLVNHIWTFMYGKKYARYSLLWILSRSVVLPITVLVNMLSPVLDRLFHDVDETLNYVVLAVKK